MSTYWNGMPAAARRGTAVVADAPQFPAYWARPIIGERISVVEVVLDGVHMAYLDDREDQGWAKVRGGGSPRVGHKNVTIEPGSFVPASQKGTK